MRFLLLTYLLSICLSSFSQLANNSPLVLTHISEENGLSDNHITCVLKDREELLWVGTRDGLNLIDGSTIRIFKMSEADSTTLPANYISGITEDKTGTIWIATANGFCSYNKKTHRFHRVLTFGTNKTSLGSLTNIVADNNHSLWFGATQGLFEYDYAAKTVIQHYNSDGNSVTGSANKINSVTVSSDQKIWLATFNGLWMFDPVIKTFTSIVNEKNDHNYHPLCLAVYEDEQKNIWVGFWSKGLKKWDRSTKQLMDYGNLLRGDYDVNAIIGLDQNNGDKRLWLNGRLFAFDRVTQQYLYFQQPITEREFPEVKPVYRSQDGWIWLASDNGLYIYNPNQQVFHHTIFGGAATSQGIIFSSYKNGILVGAQANDFLKWKDTKGNVIKDYSNFCRNSAATLSLIQDGPDDIWMGTTAGILHANLTTGATRWFDHQDSDTQSIPRNFIATVFLDSKKNLWVFPWREGIWQMNTQTGACHKLWDGFINEKNGIKKLLISDAVEDDDGNIWMADLDEGIIFYDAQKKQFSKPFEKEIGSRTHTARIFKRNGLIYSALDNAFLRWDPHTKQLTFFTPPAELNKTITDIYPDLNGNWWLVTVSGLVAFNEKDNSFRRFTTADGLYQNDIKGNLFCANDSMMLIGSPNYFSFFKPGNLTASVEQKTVLLTSFLADNREISTEEGKTVSLSYSENNIVIRWALPSYNNPFGNQYYYRLEGIDSGWRYTGNKGEVQYANLSPGHYTISLKASTANEIQSANIITLHFTIHPPYWKTTWFILLCIAVAGIVFFTVVRYISQRNLKEKLLRLEKEQAIEKERNRISRDMHDDLGSGLTKIAIMSEVVKKQMAEPEKARQQLDNISVSSRELVDNLQDIIWVLNPKNDTVESLAAYVREYALKFFEPFGIALKFDYPESFPAVSLSEEKRRNIFLVLKETFNNAAKHAWCNQVGVIILPNDKEVVLKVMDDGKGFDPLKVRDFGNGLINMKNRIAQIGGEYHIDSSPGKGTTTTITVPS